MKKVIHYALILDQSGSMQGLQKEVIASFNEQVEMIRKLQKNSPEARIKVTLCVFNDVVRFQFQNRNVEELPELTRSEYQPHSLTALYDAMGKTINAIDELVKKDDGVFLAIFTDGLENASKQFSAQHIQLKLAEAEGKGWNIRFFCRHSDNAFYKHNLALKDQLMQGISVNEDGLNEMNYQVNFGLDQLINNKNKE